MYVGLISWSEDHDPEPYALADLRPDRPAGPALQTSPETGTPEDELIAWQEGQRTLLEGSPTMLDEATARIPIEMAIAAEVERRARRSEIGAAIDSLIGDELTAPEGDPEMDREMSGLQLLDDDGETLEVEGAGPIPLSIQEGERQRAAARSREAARADALGPMVEMVEMVEIDDPDPVGEPAPAESDAESGTDGTASAVTDTTAAAEDEPAASGEPPTEP
jgi:hypothetical protein